MPNAVTGIFSHVEHKPVAPLVDTIDPGHFLGRCHHFGKIGGVVCGEHTSVVDMPARNDEDMGRGGWIEISKCHGSCCFDNDRRRYVARYDSTEQALHDRAKVSR